MAFGNAQQTDRSDKTVVGLVSDRKRDLLLSDECFMASRLGLTSSLRDARLQFVPKSALLDALEHIENIAVAIVGTSEDFDFVDVLILP